MTTSIPHHRTLLAMLSGRYPTLNPDPLRRVVASIRTDMRKKTPSYHLELLPSIPAFARRARNRRGFDEGQLVYYGPMPTYYGIGEVKKLIDGFVAVDFRGTGQFGVHEDMFEPQYLIPIPVGTMGLL